MNYFEARSYERCVRSFRRDAELYWAGDKGAPTETELRERFSEVDHCVKALGFNPVWMGVDTSIADTWGNYVSDVLSRRAGRKEGSRAFLDQCVGSARLARRRALNRLLFPWCWPVDLLGMLIAFPVRAMRVAGLPRLEEHEYSKLRSEPGRNASSGPAIPFAKAGRPVSHCFVAYGSCTTTADSIWNVTRRRKKKSSCVSRGFSR